MGIPLRYKKDAGVGGNTLSKWNEIDRYKRKIKARLEKIHEKNKNKDPLVKLCS